MRRFMQTFVLAPQSPKKYYVHNDIFRYQDEVFDDADNSTSSGNNVTVASSSDNNVASTSDQIREMKEMNAAAVMEGNKLAEVERQHTNGSNNYEDNTNIAPAPVEPMNVEENNDSSWKPEPVIISSPVEVSAPVVAEWKSPEPEMAQQDETEEGIAMAAGDEDPGGPMGGNNPDQPRTWSSMVKSGAALGSSKPPAGSQTQKEGTPVFQGSDQRGHQKPSSGYARGHQRGSSQGRSPGQRSERFSKDESDPRQSEMTKNG